MCARIKDAYEEKNGILGYRQMTIEFNRENDFHVNEKRILRLMRILQLKSTSEITAENILNREFYADHFGEKWLTDVTEMKYGINGKVYLSAILDLADKSIVSFVMGSSDDNAFVFKTFDIAHQEHPAVKRLILLESGVFYNFFEQFNLE